MKKGPPYWSTASTSSQWLNRRCTSGTSQSQPATLGLDVGLPTRLKLKQATFPETVEKRQKCKHSDERKKHIDQLVLNMIIQDTKPVSIVEGKGFWKNIEYLDPRYDMITRSAIRDKTPASCL